jgi:tetratricopeptide (TPR) repeat protein
LKTPRPHFEELDWLDFEQGFLEPRERAEMEGHLSDCLPCRERAGSLRRLSRGLGPMRELLESAGRDSVEANEAVVAAAVRTAEEIADWSDRARAELVRFGEVLPPPGSVRNLSWYHVEAANRLARECLAKELPRARSLVDWCRTALDELDGRQDRGQVPGGLAGAVRATGAYLRLTEGRPAEALEEIDAARGLPAGPLPLRDLETAFCSYVRTTCLHHLSRFEEGLREIASCEEIYAAYGDGRRRARSRFWRAILLSDGGAPERALPIYDELLSDKDLIADAPIHAILHLSLANDLIFTGETARAKAVYARAAVLLKKTGQQDRLFRIRVGLADIAYREGRVEEALNLNLQLRPVFRERRLAWDEVRRELWIIRQLLELERFGEARSLCSALASRAEELSLKDEARRALSLLARADRELTAERVTRVQSDIDLLSRGEVSRGSVA